MVVDAEDIWRWISTGDGGKKYPEHGRGAYSGKGLSLGGFSPHAFLIHSASLLLCFCWALLDFFSSFMYLFITSLSHVI